MAQSAACASCFPCSSKISAAGLCKDAACQFQLSEACPCLEQEGSEQQQRQQKGMHPFLMAGSHRPTWLLQHQGSALCVISPFPGAKDAHSCLQGAGQRRADHNLHLQRLLQASQVLLHSFCLNRYVRESEHHMQAMKRLQSGQGRGTHLPPAIGCEVGILIIKAAVCLGVCMPCNIVEALCMPDEVHNLQWPCQKLLRGWCSQWRTASGHQLPLCASQGWPLFQIQPLLSQRCSSAPPASLDQLRWQPEQNAWLDDCWADRRQGPQMLQCVKQLCSRSRGVGQLTRMLPQVQVNLGLQATAVSLHCWCLPHQI